jgi:AcrR family transcriptional regulator
MFLQEGYSATSMEAVAARAGTSKGTLYARFETKASLFAAVVVSRVSAWSAEAARQDFKLGTTLQERLEHHATIFLDKMATQEIFGLSRLTMAESHRFPELGRIVHENAHQFAVNILAQEIEAGSGTRIAARNARAVANALMESLYGWACTQVTLNAKSSAAARRQIAKHRVALFLEGRAAW